MRARSLTLAVATSLAAGSSVAQVSSVTAGEVEVRRAPSTAAQLIPDSTDWSGLLDRSLLEQLDSRDAGLGLTPAQALVAATDPLEHLEEEDPQGFHLRFGTKRGPVHVWIPEGFRRASAGVVVYVHGYFLDVDAAWASHRLAAQFAQSRRNAVFIAAQAPSSWRDDVFWKSLDELLATVARRVRKPLPTGPVVVVGHSGAFRSVAEWLDSARLTQVVLIDGLYGYDEEFWAWMAKARPPRRKLVLVAIETVMRSDRLMRRLRLGVLREGIPERFEELTYPERVAPLLYLRQLTEPSDGGFAYDGGDAGDPRWHADGGWKGGVHDHFTLVTSGQLVPLLLRLTALPALPKAKAAPGRPVH